MKKDNTKKLSQLGSQDTKYNYSEPSSEILETFENQFPHRDYVVEYVFKEFSSLCPKTGQPDTAEIIVRYIPDEKCIETKSLKLYFLAFRQHGAFMETITNTILEDCVKACNPRKMTIESSFAPRGGTYINVNVEYEAN
jgi:7-cyano-7-deazaguanine reductase